MRKSAALNWIEQAEETQVLSAAFFERAVEPMWRDRASDTLADWCDRLCAFVAPRQAVGGRPGSCGRCG